MTREQRLEHETVRTAIDEVRRACRRAALPFGIFTPTPEGAGAERDKGSTLIAVGSDVSLLSDAVSRALAAVGGPRS